MNEEIKRLQEAIKKTKSPYLKRDYKKAIKRLRRQHERKENKAQNKRFGEENNGA